MDCASLLHYAMLLQYFHVSVLSVKHMEGHSIVECLAQYRCTAQPIVVAVSFVLFSFDYGRAECYSSNGHLEANAIRLRLH